MMPGRIVYIGFDAREAAAFAVARESIGRFDSRIHIRGLVLDELRKAGLYTRPTERRDGKLWDVISGAPMSTEFAISRFLVPTLAAMGDLIEVRAIGDVLFRANPAELFEIASQHESKAVLCVQHDHRPQETTKMDGQTQTVYPRKNWSSVMMFNLDHPANKALTVEMVNTLPGRDLHRFCWLNDDEIGALGPEWNHLIGEQPESPKAKIAHFTLGVPTMAGYENCEFSDEWKSELHRWANAS
jgi:hypothetical protein